MSLGDELRYLRARARGLTPSEIADATGVDPSFYVQLEQRYREMGDDETVEKLAAFFESDPEMLKHARALSRKALSFHLHDALENEKPIQLRVRTGETLEGHVVWWDLGTLGLQTKDADAILVIQRHAVIDW